jgi:phosphatidylglycerophosphate synthase
MLTNSSAEVFNADALLYGGAMLFLILVVHATYMFLVTRQSEVITDALIESKRYVWMQPVFYVMAFFLALSHLLEIYIWGSALSIFGLIKDEHQAMVFAGSAYTTVGFGTNPLPPSWDLIMVVIALSGMITFGWSISVLLNMTQIVHTARQKRKENNQLNK